MLIYVEGPAGAGKSSFIRQAQLECPEAYEIFNEYALNEDPSIKKDFDTFLSNTELKIKHLREISSHKNLLVDRGHLSMLVNAFVEQHYGLNQTFDTAMSWYENYKASNDFLEPDLYVYITAPQELIVERAKSNDWYREDLGWLRDPQLAMDTYEQFFKDLEPNTPVLRLDGSKKSSELVAGFLKYANDLS